MTLILILTLYRIKLIWAENYTALITLSSVTKEFIKREKENGFFFREAVYAQENMRSILKKRNRVLGFWFFFRFFYSFYFFSRLLFSAPFLLSPISISCVYAIPHNSVPRLLARLLTGITLITKNHCGDGH